MGRVFEQEIASGFSGSFVAIYMGASEPFEPSAQGRVLMRLREQELAAKGTLPEPRPCYSGPSGRAEDL